MSTDKDAAIQTMLEEWERMYLWSCFADERGERGCAHCIAVKMIELARSNGLYSEEQRA